MRGPPRAEDYRRQQYALQNAQHSGQRSYLRQPGQARLGASAGKVITNTHTSPRRRLERQEDRETGGGRHMRGGQRDRGRQAHAHKSALLTGVFVFLCRHHLHLEQDISTSRCLKVHSRDPTGARWMGAGYLPMPRELEDR